MPLHVSHHVLRYQTAQTAESRRNRSIGKDNPPLVNSTTTKMARTGSTLRNGRAYECKEDSTVGIADTALQIILLIVCKVGGGKLSC